MSAVTLEDARRIIDAAEKKAKGIGQPMNIAVADEGGNIVAHVRMDGAWIGSSDISMKKAYTSRAFDIATKDLATHSQSGGQFFGIHASNNGKIMIFAGGVPLTRDGKVVGAIGVSGDTSCADHIIAWKVRHLLNLDNIPPGVSPTRDDNIIFDITADTNGHPVSASSWGHPICSADAKSIAEQLPRTHPIGPNP